MAVERDFRKLAPATQAELRRIAVAMVRAGKTRIEAAAMVGVNRRFVGQWVGGGAIGRGGPGGPASRSSPGRAEGTERGAGRGVALSDRPWLSRSVRFVFCAVDASSGAGADRARERGVAEPIGGRRLSAGLGLHGTAAGAPGHRATGRGSPGLAGEHLSGDCPQGPGGLSGISCAAGRLNRSGHG